jgi:hypothetical protein
MVSLGKLVKSAGTFYLEVSRTLEGKVHARAKLLNNETGHFQADVASLYAHKDEIIEAIRNAGIRTEGMEITSWSF